VLENVDDGAFVSTLHLKLKVADVGLDIMRWLCANLLVAAHGRTEKRYADARDEGLGKEWKELIEPENNMGRFDSSSLDIYADDVYS
jgi:hypothetical protein